MMQGTYTDFYSIAKFKQGENFDIFPFFLL